ncbi:SAF domain-containing protein [Demequina salsinemoris]|uniref:SAF domain-containing protein n=1 Tax=Demequina salsinemoris TaxID=577470 RepID=UPI000780C064|nr:SAF domain-containing protein [Demequina salsinemoris]
MATTTGMTVGRLARPGWRDPRLLVGLVLIAASVAGVVSLVRANDRTAPVYVAVDDLVPGAVLDEGDLAVAHVRVDGDAYVGAAEEPWGQVVTRAVGEGELLPAEALAEAEDFTGRPVAVRTTRPIAEAIDRGSLVDVWLTVTDDDGPSSELVAQSLVVDAVDRDDGSFAGTGVETVYVVVPADEMEGFLDAIAVDGDLSVVGLAG